MAFSLSIDGYDFDNPPLDYRKRIMLGNSPQPHFEKNATPYYRSDSQQITLELSGRLNLNDQDDLDELERIQKAAIEGGEVDVEFDPFFSGSGVIEDEPIEQENQRGRYSFSIAINEETTNDSAYPAHATPTTGNTFELGDFDFGFDPDSVSQEYERQTERVDRLQGVAQTSDTKGLVTRVSLEGRVDGGGQAELWSKARSNAMAYLSAEFQNGWALLNSLSISKDDATPDYLQGLFQYSAEFLIVKDPTSGIGEVSQFINHDVGDSGTYTSDEDAGSGSDAGGLEFKVLGGTGSVDGRYVDWVTTTITLEDNTTNYVFVDDSDGDGVGQVAYNSSGFPGTDALPLYEVDTSNGEIVDVRDVRESLLGSGDDTASDFIFRDEFAIDDTAFTYAQLLRFSDQVANPALAQDYLGKAELSDSIADPVEGPILPAKGLASLSESINLIDGGSPGGATSFTESWSAAGDWDAAQSEAGVVHDSFGDYSDAGSVYLGYPTDVVSDLEVYYPLDEDSGSTVNDVSGNGYDATNQGPAVGATGINGTTCYDFSSGDYISLPSIPMDTWSGWTMFVWLYPTFSISDNRDIFGANLDADDFRIRTTDVSFDDGSFTVMSPENDLTRDTWQSFAVTADQSEVAYFVDGVEGDRVTDSHNLADIHTSDMVLGARFNETLDTGATWVGRYDSPIFVSRALSASEISSLHDATTSGSITTGKRSL